MKRNLPPTVRSTFQPTAACWLGFVTTNRKFPSMPFRNSRFLPHPFGIRRIPRRIPLQVSGCRCQEQRCFGTHLRHQGPRDAHPESASRCRRLCAPHSLHVRPQQIGCRYAESSPKPNGHLHGQPAFNGVQTGCTRNEPQICNRSGLCQPQVLRRPLCLHL